MRRPLVPLLMGLAACAGPPPPGAGAPPAPRDAPAEVGTLPAVPPVDGPLDLRVIYPPAGSTVTARDSSFLFGSTGSGRAGLTINGAPVRVWPNGAWLAWVPFPGDTLVAFELEARRDTAAVTLRHEVRRAPTFRPAGGLWVDTTSFSPRGEVWWPAREPLPLTVRAAEGASLRLLLPGGGAVPLVPLPRLAEVPAGVRAFDRDPANLAAPVRRDRYSGALRGVALGGARPPVLGARTAGGDAAGAVLEAVLGSDTVRTSWPMRVALLADPLPLATVDDDPSRTGRTDGITPGRALPGGTYHWFFPNGTRAAVSGRINGDVRLRLSDRSEAWVAAAELQPVAEGALPGRATVGSLTATGRPGWTEVRIPVSWRVPFRVDEDHEGLTLTLFGAAGDPDWIRYGETPGHLRLITWRQAVRDEVEFRFTLRRPLWGYRTRWEGADLLLELRPVPPLDPERPLRDRLIVVDPGHPPAGATGPTGLTEAEANLGVALVLRDLLERAGARVVLTREDARPVELWPRVRLADSLDADLLVSIHNNALPDGVNPFTNHGTSVFYFQPRSLPLATAVQAGLVRRLGLPDLGVGRGDLALVRGTWMPSVLTEGLFMMLPPQEAALRSEAGRRAYAEGVVDGIRSFLREAARGAAPPL